MNPSSPYTTVVKVLLVAGVILYILWLNGVSLPFVPPKPGPGPDPDPVIVDDLEEVGLIAGDDLSREMGENMVIVAKDLRKKKYKTASEAIDALEELNVGAHQTALTPIVELLDDAGEDLREMANTLEALGRGMQQAGKP